MTLLMRRKDYPVGFGNDFFSAFDSFFNDLKLADGAGFSPLLDIREDDRAYYLDVELPGIPKENVSMEVNDGQLIISGEKKTQSEDSYHRAERVYGKFYRSLSVPENVDTAKIEAKMENGVLHVTLNKLPEEKPRVKAIEIK